MRGAKKSSPLIMITWEKSDYINQLITINLALSNCFGTLEEPITVYNKLLIQLLNTNFSIVENFNCHIFTVITNLIELGSICFNFLENELVIVRKIKVYEMSGGKKHDPNKNRFKMH